MLPYNVRFPFPLRRSALILAVVAFAMTVGLFVPSSERSRLCFASSGCDITVGTDPTQGIISGTGLYVTNSTASSVSVIDTRTNAVVKTVSVGSGPRYAIASGTGVYVLNQSAGTVSVIDRVRNVVAATITVGTTPYGRVLAGTGLYISNSGGGTVSVIDLRTNTVAKTLTVGGTPYSVAVSGTGVYATNFADDTVSVIDNVRNIVVKTVTVGDGPVTAVLSGTGMYVANQNAGTVSVIDTRTNTVSKTITADTTANAFGVSGTGVYVANYGGNNVTVIDRVRNVAVKTLSVGTSPFWIAISGTGAFVSNLNSSNVTIIDTVRNTVAATLSTGTWPYFSVATGSTVYVPNKNPGTVTVLKQTTNSVLSVCAVCGSGLVSGSEECDDGNTLSGDGCSSTCTAEAGYTCNGGLSICTSSCPAGVAPGAASSVHYNQTCYAYYTATTRSFSDAESACVALGGHLAMPVNASIQTVLNSMGSYAWIGMTDGAVDGVYRWLDDSPFSFTYWAGGQPNGGASENCGFMENAYFWHDYPCDTARQYFCQIRDGSHPPVQGGGGLASWLIELRQRNNLNIQGQAGSSSSVSSSSSLPSSSPSVSTPSGGATANGGGGGGTLSSSSSSRSSSSSSAPAHPAAVSSLQVRTCARVKKWGMSAGVLQRLNERLLKRFGFTCPTL